MKTTNKIGYNKVIDYLCDHICEGCDQDPAQCFNQGYCEYDGPEDRRPEVQENE